MKLTRRRFILAATAAGVLGKFSAERWEWRGSAMGAEAGNLVRPLLGVARSDTAAYCQALGVEPRVDATNEDEAILRNRIRRRLLPEIEAQYAPGASKAFFW